MEPIQEFFQLLDTRTQTAISLAEQRAANWLLVQRVSISIMLGIFCTLFYFIFRNITNTIRRAVRITEQVGQGDLTYRIRARGRDEIAQLLTALMLMQKGLIGVVTTVRDGSDQVSHASSEIANSNQDLSARTEAQAGALQQTAASMEELATTVQHNASNAQQANQLAHGASTVAAQGSEVVEQVVATMQGISDSSRKIADIITVIDGIAFQTNILALNAAVEAARAGEQGRGFAVVASEVRTLAGRAADAAKEIKQLISESVERVEAGSALVSNAGSIMQEVVTSIQRVTTIMGEISNASHEQSLGVQQVSQAVSDMDQATQQNAALVEEMVATAMGLSGQAQQLVAAVAMFKLDGDTGGASKQPGVAHSGRAAAVLRPDFAVG